MTAQANSTFLRDIAFTDFEREVAATRRVLQRLPEPKFDWRPHEKSMSLAQLSLHVANLFHWQVMTLESDELDMGNPPTMRKEAATLVEVMDTFEAKSAAAREALARTTDADLAKPWTLRYGLQIMHSGPKATILRVWCMNHLVHHRGQLCLYLRLLGVPVPAVYFNSADEPGWMFE